jgi:uncharacterized LabA/DUF88 family protein
MNRVTFLVDGFNVYHSILRFKRETGYIAKWLNLESLCNSYIHLFGKDAKLESIYYFSALPNYLTSQNPDKIKRHQIYINCLQSTGIKIELGRFKKKDVYCPKCRSTILKHEEKETDVAIAVKLFEVFHTNSCDTAVIVSGDTDLSPAIRTCKKLFKNKEIVFAFPYARMNRELSSLVPNSFTISGKQYIKHQFPNPVILNDGRTIYKPKPW